MKTEKILNTVKIPTSHWLVFMQPYILNEYTDQFAEYIFAYLHLREPDWRFIESFQMDWRKGESRVNKLYQISEDAILLHSDLFNQPEKYVIGDEYIKYDSYSFLDGEVNLIDIPHYKIAANVILKYDHLVVIIERIPDGYDASSVIFKSGRIPYFKFEELLRTYEEK